MKKYWFKHHGKASTDPRMKMLKEALGYAGIGVYWEIVEYIETWGDGQYPRKALLSVLVSPRVSKKMVNSILDDFYLFERNEFEDIVLSSIAVGECSDLMLQQMLQSSKREQEEEELRRRRFEMRQRWLPLEDTDSGKNGEEKDLTLEKTEERGTLTHVKTEEPATGQGAHAKKREEEIREEVDDDDAHACVREEPWMQYVEPLKQEQTGWQDVVCMKSGYGALLRRRWQEAIEEFVRHVVEHDQGHTIQNAHDARYYFASYARLSVRSGQKLRDCLQASEDAEAEERKESDPYRYELRVDGVRYASGRPIPPEAPPRPTATAVWNDATGTWGEGV